MEGAGFVGCSKCTDDAVAWFPAFDRKEKPKPYCQKHLELARKTMVLEGPRMVNVRDRQPALTMA